MGSSVRSHLKGQFALVTVFRPLLLYPGESRIQPVRGSWIKNGQGNRDISGLVINGMEGRKERKLKTKKGQKEEKEKKRRMIVKKKEMGRWSDIRLDRIEL